MNNYEFCSRWVLDQSAAQFAEPAAQNVRVLDYGCGTGQIIRELRRRNVDAVGCDVFYGGARRAKLVPAEYFDGGIIQEMSGSAAPFDESSFEFVINNQVMEHVEDLDKVVGEIHRVLKPGGVVLSLFPDKGVWREGHCGIPFLHRFPKHSTARVYFAAIFRSLGLGYHKGSKGVVQWSRDFCVWLDNWTHYRSRSDVNSTYRKYFHEITHMEDRWLRSRLGGNQYLADLLPTSMQRLIVRKLGGLVFVARKLEK